MKLYEAKQGFEYDNYLEIFWGESAPEKADFYLATEVDPLLTLAKQMRDALGWYVRTGRCENPTRKPLPNPKGYREYVRIVPCGECHWCRAYAAIAAYDKLMEDE